MPTAFSEYEKGIWPLPRNRSLHTTTAIPASKPIATLPPGPIRLLSNAHFRKNDTPINTAAMPIRFSQTCPIFLSRLAPESISCPRVDPENVANEGGGVEVGTDAGGTGLGGVVGVVVVVTGCGGATGRGATGAVIPSRCSRI